MEPLEDKDLTCLREAVSHEHDAACYGHCPIYTSLTREQALALLNEVQQLRDRLDLVSRSRRRWIDAIAAVFPPGPGTEPEWNDSDQAQLHMQILHDNAITRAKTAEQKRDEAYQLLRECPIDHLSDWALKRWQDRVEFLIGKKEG